MRLTSPFLLGLLLFQAAGDRTAFASDCAEIRAPHQFKIKGATAETASTPGNRGIITQGFVTLPDVPVVHGIDVSKWQPSADFVRAKACGARFAYVRLSAGTNGDNELEYRSHWANARSVGLMVGPYHNLTVIEGSGHYTLLSEAEKSDLLKANGVAARAQARLFIQRLTEVLSLDPKQPGETSQRFLGQPYLPIALDVSARPHLKRTANERQAFGHVYAAAACAWIDEVRKNPMFARQTIILFTLPYVYKDYELGKSSCELDRLPVWISYRPTNGDAPENETVRTTRDAIRNLCNTSPSTNRCILQQYTSWGGFALYDDTQPLDLNRFLGNETALRATLQKAAR